MGREKRGVALFPNQLSLLLGERLGRNLEVDRVPVVRVVDTVTDIPLARFELDQVPGQFQQAHELTDRLAGEHLVLLENKVRYLDAIRKRATLANDREPELLLPLKHLQDRLRSWLDQGGILLELVEHRFLVVIQGRVQIPEPISVGQGADFMQAGQMTTFLSATF